MMRRASFCIFALAAIWPQAGRAQQMGVVPILSTTTGTGPLSVVLREKMRGAPGAEPAPPIADDRAFVYRPDLKRRKANLAQFVAKSRATDPQGADNLARLFAQGDIIERMRPELAKYGLEIDNVADAYTVWWINAWQASRGLTGDASSVATTAVRHQVMETMAATPAFRGASEPDKQELAESLLVQALLLAGAVDQAKGDPGQLDAVSRAAIQGAQGMSVDLTAMELTDDGFVPAR